MTTMATRSYRLILVVSSLVMVTLVTASLGMLLGSVPISPRDVYAWLCADPKIDPITAIVLGQARLPRLVVGWMVGAALGAVGALMQSWTRNPMAGPGLLGLNGGAAMAMALAVVVNPLLGPAPMAGVAIAGAAAGGALVVLLASIVPAGNSPFRLVVVGAVAGALLSSATASVVIASGMQNDLLFWMVGGLGAVGWRDAVLLTIASILSFGLIVFIIQDLAVVALGSDTARSLGAQPRRLRIMVPMIAIILAGTANAVAGPIAFVGFLAPHLVRVGVGPDPRRLVPTAAAAGGCLVMLADAIGRVIAPPDEQPLGLFLALLGGPALVLVAMHRRTTAAATGASA